MVTMNDYVKALILCVLCFAILAGGMVAMGWAQQQGKSYVPGVWRGDVQRPRPDFSGLPPLRVITEADYPPFNYYDEDGTLTGFNVELIQAICGVLGVTCSVEARDWEFLLPSLARKEVDIVAASITISSNSLKTADFTDHYYDTPARFIVAKGADESGGYYPRGLKGKTVGVIEGSSHQAYLQKYYAERQIGSRQKDATNLRKMLLGGQGQSDL